MRQRDIGVLVIAIVALLVSLYTRQSLYTLKPVVKTEPYVHSGAAMAASSAPSMHGTTFAALESIVHERVIVTDLESDGFNEIVSVTPSGFVNIHHRVYMNSYDTSEQPLHKRLSASIETTAQDMLKKMDENMKQAAASAELNDGGDRRLNPELERVDKRPVAFAVGFIDPMPKQEFGAEVASNRKQVILVLRRDLVLLCFSDTLELLWETHLRHFIDIAGHQLVVARETSILVTSTPIHKGDRGAIVVGVRVSKDVSGEEEGDSQPIGKYADRTYEGDTEALHHFSYFAFAGQNGALRWTHDTTDFKPEAAVGAGSDPDSVMTPQNNYRMDLTSVNQAKHSGEVNWRTYRESILGSLPHRWSQNDDTQLVLAHFSKQNRQRAPLAAMEKDDLIEMLNENIPTVSFTSAVPHSVSDVVVKPNVIVAHMQQGIEILHFYSGRTLTQVPLSPSAAYADVNGDGNIEKVYVADSQDSVTSRHGMSRCVAKIHSGPRMQLILSKDLCLFAKSGGSERFLNIQRAKNRGQAVIGDTTTGEDVSVDSLIQKLSETGVSIGSTVPLVKPRAHHSGSESQQVVSSFHGHTSTGLASRWFVQAGQEIVFALSNGMLFCYDGVNGSTKWYTKSGVSWDPESIETAPALLLVSSLVHGEPDMILFVGDRNVALVEATSGEVQSTVVLSSPINGHVVVGDFNNDGLNDFLIPTVKGTVGVCLNKEGNVPLLTTLVAGLLLCVLALYIAHNVALTGGENDLPILGTESGTSNKPSFKRATD